MAKIDAATSREALAATAIDLSPRSPRRSPANSSRPASAAGIDLGFEGDGQEMIRAEPPLIGELLRNLAGNAIAYATAPKSPSASAAWKMPCCSKSKTTAPASRPTS